ncbi:MAG: alpha/beta hydrolase [Thermoproteota archaeon]|nr:alpha/beta hydrolase [Thermoproteota archaeon]
MKANTREEGDDQISEESMRKEIRTSFDESKTETGIENQLARNVLEDYTTCFVTSKDGTTIGYRQLGRGPALVLLHGHMESAQSHIQLAEALAASFTVYLPDRRGRGLSGPYGKDYSIQKDVEDMDALLTKTGAHYVFGVSSGGIIWLQAALSLPAIHKAAIYEPPLLINGSLPISWLTRFDKEMAQGKVASALITAMKGTQMGPPIFNVIPHRLLELLTNMAMKNEDKKAKDYDVTMRMLAPTLHYDFQLVIEMAEKLESFKAIQAEVLLLGGSKSPAYFKVALDTLEKVLPHVTRIEFPGLGHGGSGNTNRGGKPERLAQELLKFFV